MNGGAFIIAFVITLAVIVIVALWRNSRGR